MPRQSRGGAPARRPAPAPAPARPQVAPPARTPAQTRPATTAAAPPATQQQAGSQGPGLFGQMASTAAGVAVGSSIGHAIGGFFGGGSAPAAPVEQANATATAQEQYNQQTGQAACVHDVQNFRRCMDENQGSLTICGWYLDQLKACQAAASQY